MHSSNPTHASHSPLHRDSSLLRALNAHRITNITGGGVVIQESKKRVLIHCSLRSDHDPWTTVGRKLLDEHSLGLSGRRIYPFQIPASNEQGLREGAALS